MSYSISYVAPDAETAKAELKQRNADTGGLMPDHVERAVACVIDALPKPNQGRAYNVACYGYEASSELPGDSNCTIAVAHVLA